MNPQEPASPHQAIRMEGLQNAALQKYRRVAWLTIAAVYCLILIGASVRASGAGMGCPDWPTCFGRWIPPVSEAQLPADYRVTYAHLGYAEARFDPLKTWTEYGNRLAGLLIGFLILLTALRSWACRHYDWRICIASVAALLQVMVQGWLGAQVVGSNLQPGMITVHTLMALAIVVTLLYAVTQAQRCHPSFHRPSVPSRLFSSIIPWLAAALALTLLQITLGTQVREMTDFTARVQGEARRSLWIEAMPWFYYVHRSFSAVVLLVNGYLAWRLLVIFGPRHRMGRLVLMLLGVILLSILSGAALGHLGMPAAVQPLHLLAASLLFGLQWLLWLGRPVHFPMVAKG